MDCQVGVMVSVQGLPGGCDGECAWIARWV